VKTYTVQCNYTLGVEMKIEARSKAIAELIAKQVEQSHLRFTRELPYDVLYAEPNYLSMPSVTVN
jgi:hypothetical protein